MTLQRQKGVIFSALLHFVWLVFAIFGLPLLIDTKPPPEPSAITVELLPITGVTNVKPAESAPAEQPKQTEKKPDQEKKPTPPVKTAENTPPPPPKVSDKAKLPPKPEEKKPEPKKTKASEADLAAVLKAVKDTASKDKPDDSKEKKSVSNQYNEGLPMSLSEKDAIRSQFAKCWQPPIGAKDAHELAVVLDMELAQDGAVIKVELASASKDRYNRDSFFRAAADSAMRAVHECSPLQSLPPEKYDTWHMMELTFDPKEMLF